MRMANTVELKNRTNELLRDVIAGQPLIVTLRGKPAAALVPLTEHDLEGFVLRYSVAGSGAPGASRTQSSQWRYTTVASPLGTVHVAYSDRGVGYLDLAPSDVAFERSFRSKFGQSIDRDPHAPGDLRRQLREYFSTYRGFRGPLDLSLVGPFQRKVLEQLRQIPRGQVRTYREVAQAIGQPGATRAVGSACARNPVPLIVPCHRVVRADGGLGGYSLRGGTALKRRLLSQEGVNVEQLRAS